jgi:hypothetical protein
MAMANTRMDDSYMELPILGSDVFLSGRFLVSVIRHSQSCITKDFKAAQQPAYLEKCVITSWINQELPILKPHFPVAEWGSFIIKY